ncbi:uncharacterized protein EI97DRAFT_437920 [Westerdykella ornata]|uniref:Uncharacterized protein n=1 Tax=Westerdykella ornata TaxID=318751 RepID=A0A6A6J466_WESOR|nr:uncharacterized protein EI97DRAFT_437920 [Westerdykella ornata]KAF2271360.1 hypothetical protein EI97DRAFT_437920 [Westerdykella ornata]
MPGYTVQRTVLLGANIHVTSKLRLCTPYSVLHQRNGASKNSGQWCGVDGTTPHNGRSSPESSHGKPSGDTHPCGTEHRHPSLFTILCSAWDSSAISPFAYTTSPYAGSGTVSSIGDSRLIIGSRNIIDGLWMKLFELMDE